jgi:hypothetical protein
VAVAGLAMVLLAACGGTNRPEGVVENWLNALNQGKAGQPQKYALSAVSTHVLPNWQECDPGSLDVIEVGARAQGMEGGPNMAFVPYRIKYASDLSSCDTSERPSAPVRGVAVAEKKGGTWQVRFVEGVPRGSESALRLPSEGGPRIGSASLSALLITLAVSVVLMLLVALLIRTTPEPTPLPKEQPVSR